MRSRLAFVTLLGLPLTCAPGLAAVLHPSDFASLGAFPSGGFTIDTDDLTYGGAAGGVLRAQGGGAPDIAVFVFDGEGVLAAGDSLTVTGSNALAILFQGSATIQGVIDVSGASGAEPIPNVVTGIGGLGVAGGGRGGNGGPFSAGQDGEGPGHGVVGSNSASVSGIGSGAGAGFGTAGGDGGVVVTNRPGGLPYGDPLRDALHAGSGGGGGGGQGNTRLGGGGGAGGGALEIGALTTLEFIGATVLANGGNGANGFADGGGGSGGGVLLHAYDIYLDAATVIQANGGDGGADVLAGGCGGAGRIEMVHNSGGGVSNLGTVETMAGDFNGSCVPGEPVVTAMPGVGVPEPAACCLTGMGLLSLIAASSRGRPTGVGRRPTD